MQQLSQLYIQALRADCLSRIPSVALWGSMGVGKSAAVHEIAEQISRAIGQEVGVTDIRLLNFSPVDLRGVPFADVSHEFTVWLKPKLFDLDPAKVHILFLDEISSAPQSLQATAYQIALDKRIGEFTLPENCIVICAGNRTTDKSVVYRMPKALANRLMHFEILSDFDSWYVWALENGIHEKVLGYLSFNNKGLNTDEVGIDELAFPTPRSWEFVSHLLQTDGREPKEMHDLLAGCIGVSAALAFEAWCEVYQTLPATADIFSGKCKQYPRKTDALYAVTASMISYITQSGARLAVSKLEHACSYAAGLPADFAMMFFNSIMDLEEVRLRLMNVSSFLEWMQVNRQYL